MDRNNQIIRCNLRGKFKKELHLKKDKQFIIDPVAVGDHVKFNLNFDGSGTINYIYPRKNYISRKAVKSRGSSYRGERLEQIVASNLDNIFIVTSIDQPKFNNRLLDRIIVTGESAGISVKIIINKIDLDEDDYAMKWFNLYSSIGYKVFLTSVIEKKGVDQIKKILKNKKNLFWGISGVGKSSLLNLLFNSLNLNVGEISTANKKGKHTTVTSKMFYVDKNTFVIDTPGVREIDPYGITKENLSYYFVEFKPFLDDCKFNTCTHFHEPGCAVINAVETGIINQERYISYLNILATIEDNLYF